MRLALERSREELQRQLAGLDAQLQLSQSRLADAGSENQALTQRLALERGRVAELEGEHWQPWLGLQGM